VILAHCRLRHGKVNHKPALAPDNTQSSKTKSGEVDVVNFGDATTSFVPVRRVVRWNMGPNLLGNVIEYVSQEIQECHIRMVSNAVR